jgi:hypothetical protein
VMDYLQHVTERLALDSAVSVVVVHTTNATHNTTSSHYKCFQGLSLWRAFFKVFS